MVPVEDTGGKLEPYKKISAAGRAAVLRETGMGKGDKM
jgi:hypothetical protein